MATASKASPPKPWERAGAGPASSTSSSVSSLTGSSTGSTPATMSSNNDSSSTSSSAPALPARPADMSSSSTSSSSNALTNSAYGANRYGTTATTGYGATSAYGATGYGGMSSYASPYSRFGGGYGGGYGGYGGGFGGYGGAYGSPYGGYGAGMPGGMAGDMSLTRQMEAGTQATFQLLQSVVSAFGGFAQMLESTYMATHSSFFAMIGVAEQFASLRTWLGEVLSVFTLLRFVKRMLGYGGGGGENSAQQGQGANGLSAADFNNFNATGRTTPVAGGQAGAGGVPGKPKVSKKPIVIFFLTVIGLPWLMNKLVKLITAKQQAEARRLGLPEGAIPPLMDHNGQPLPQHLQPPGVDLSFLNNNPQLIEQQRVQQEASIDPATLTFVRAQYPHTSNDQFELSFNKGDIIAVLTPKEERQDPGWWRGRLRDGSIGWFPSTHVQEIPMNNAQKKLEQQQQQPEGKGTKV